VGAEHRSSISAMKRAMEVATNTGPVRMTDEQIKAERVEKMREKDPVLGAAIDALDLELLD